MVKKVIQVPVDEDLLKSLDNFSKKERKARSEVIRRACAYYLQQVKNEELNKLYQQGYIRIPEEPETGNIQIAVTPEVLHGESW